MKATRLILAVIAATFSTLVLAGYVQPAPVAITDNGDGSGAAQGDMVSARFSDNDVEFIGCGMRVYDDGVGGSFEYGFCQAGDADGVQGFCSTFRSDMIEAIKASSDYSYLTFSWDTAGECNHVGTSTQSFYIPEHTDKSKKK